MKKFNNTYTNVVSEASVKKLMDTYVATRKLPESTFNDLLAIDPSDTNKYLPWLISVYMKERPVTLDGLKEIIQKFHELTRNHRIRGQESDVQQYKTSEAMYDIVKHYDEPSKSEVKRGVKGLEDVNPEDVILNNEKVLILLPKNKEDSCKYGRKSRWCTAAMGHSNYFNRYFYQDGVNLYYILPKVEMEEKYAKIAVAVYPSGEKEVYDLFDNRMESEFPQIAKELGIPL